MIPRSSADQDGLLFPPGGFGLGGCHAGLKGIVRSLGFCRICDLRARHRQNARGANLYGDDLHDDLQFGIRDLSICLHRTRHPADGCRNDNQQRKREHVVPVGLHQSGAGVPVQLRARVAVAITFASITAQLSSAIDSVIESNAFSVAARPMSIASAARWKSSQLM
jgi:hypothetical protein